VKAFSTPPTGRIIDVKVICVGQGPAQALSGRELRPPRSPVIIEVPAYAISERLIYQRNGRPKHLGTRSAGLFLNTIA